MHSRCVPISLSCHPQSKQLWTHIHFTRAQLRAQQVMPATATPSEQAIRTAHAHRNPQVHTITSGSSNTPLLQTLAAEGGGRHRTCQSGVDLAATFVSIAAGCITVEGLVQGLTASRVRPSASRSWWITCEG